MGEYTTTIQVDLEVARELKRVAAEQELALPWLGRDIPDGYSGMVHYHAVRSSYNTVIRLLLGLGVNGMPPLLCPNCGEPVMHLVDYPDE